MRRALAAAGIAVALLSSVIGTGPAAARVDAAMSRSGSPVSAGNLPTAEQMSKGLLTLAEMPTGYTAFGRDQTGDTTEVPTSGWCREAVLDRSAPTPRVYRAFKHPDGTIFAAEIVATGTRKANQLVEAATTVTTRCPVVEGDLTTKKHSRLALPDLGVRATGVDEMFQDPFGEWSRLHHAVVATGGVTGVYTEMGSHPRHRARFLDLVKASVQKLRTATALTVEDLRTGLLHPADLPAGYVVSLEGTPETDPNAYSFNGGGTTCTGREVPGSGGPVPAIFRTYARGAYGTPNIVEAIGATGPGLARAIVAMQEENGRTCPDTKDNEGTTRTFSALSLPPIGDAAAGTLRTGGSELRIAEIWVASGDVCAVYVRNMFDVSDAEGVAELRKVAEAGAKRLAAIRN
jgi:hypothetical protein